MATMKMMILLLGLVAMAFAAPQFNPSHVGSSGFSSFNNHGLKNSSSEEDSTDRSVDTVTSSPGASANNSHSSSGDSSLKSQLYGRPSFTEDANPSSSSSSFRGSSSFSSSAGKPFATEIGSGSSGAGVGASGSSSLDDSSDLTGSASDVHFSRDNSSPISGADAASPASVSPSSGSAFVSSGSSNGFLSGSDFHPSVFQASSAADTTAKNNESRDAATEASSSDSTFKFGSRGASNTQRSTFF